MFELLSSSLKYIFIFLIYLFIYWIARLIYLDIRTTYRHRPVKRRNQAYLKLINQQDELDFKVAESYPLGEIATIGRSAGNDIVLADPFVSGEHAILKQSGQQYFIEDLASTNGTFVNGVKTSQRVALNDGDRISFSRINFIFVSEHK